MTARGLIYDFDGTLVDTMPIHYEAYRRTFAEVGLELTRDQFFANIGGKARETIPRFLAGRPCPHSIDELHARKQAIAAELLESADLPRLATSALLPVFHGVHPIALASSGSRSGIEIVLRRLDWTRYFDAIVTGADAPRGKPAPDLFLLAAERIGVPCADCLVFEDTDDGVAAARAAGMSVFDVRRAAAPSLRSLA
jgi:HAD superfamily hydrolase (TIGR01509 family)